MGQTVDQEPFSQRAHFERHSVAQVQHHVVAHQLAIGVLHVVVHRYQVKLLLHVMHILPMCKTNLNKIEHLVLLHTTFAHVKCAKV